MLFSCSFCGIKWNFMLWDSITWQPSGWSGNFVLLSCIKDIVKSTKCCWVTLDFTLHPNAYMFMSVWLEGLRAAGVVFCCCRFLEEFQISCLDQYKAALCCLVLQQSLHLWDRHIKHYAQTFKVPIPDILTFKILFLVTKSGKIYIWRVTAYI